MRALACTISTGLESRAWACRVKGLCGRRGEELSHRQRCFHVFGYTRGQRVPGRGRDTWTGYMRDITGTVWISPRAFVRPFMYRDWFSTDFSPAVLPVESRYTWLHKVLVLKYFVLQLQVHLQPSLPLNFGIARPHSVVFLMLFWPGIYLFEHIFWTWMPACLHPCKSL